MRKILVIHLGTRNAGPQLLWEFAKGISEDKQIQVAIAFNPDADFSIRNAFNTENEFPIRTYRSRSMWSLCVSFLRVPFIGLKIKKAVSEGGFSCVISVMESPLQSLSLPFWAGRSAEYVSIIHDGTLHPGAPWILRLGRLLELKYASRFVTFSAHAAKQLGLRTDKRITALWHPPFDSFFDPNFNQKVEGDVVKMLFFGRLEKYKGLELLLQACKLARERGAEFVLEIHGAGPEGKLENTELGLEAIWHQGYVPQSQILPLIGRFDCVVLPYVEASQSGVIAQCFAAKKPVLATPVGGLEQQLADFPAGLVSKEANAESFGELIHSFCKDLILRNKLQMSFANASPRSDSWRELARGVMKDD
jgi:glycosyltransferase involved in cell wall biosynthesis